MEKVNGHAPFSSRKSWITATRPFLFERQCSVFWGDLAIKTPFLATGESQCSDFLSDFQHFRRYLTDMLHFLTISCRFFSSQVGGLNRSEWVDMLSFLHFFLLSSFVIIPHCSRLAFATPLLCNRRQSEVLSNIYRRPIEDLSNIYRRPIEVIIRQFYFIPLHCLSVAPYFPNFTVFTFEPEEMVRR